LGVLVLEVSVVVNLTLREAVAGSYSVRGLQEVCLVICFFWSTERKLF